LGLVDYQNNGVYSSAGTIVFTYKIPEDIKGGVYTIKVKSRSSAESFRTVRINQDTTPELYITGDFDKTNYSPGDIINLKVKVRRPDGQPLPNGSKISSSEYASYIMLDAMGEVEITFTLKNYGVKVYTTSISAYLGFSETPVVA
jgi:uncharacterized protein YfaS (alpha-2-macroglobulin family)